jgi:hypothetical protein
MPVGGDWAGWTPAPEHVLQLVGRSVRREWGWVILKSTTSSQGLPL